MSEYLQDDIGNKSSMRLVFVGWAILVGFIWSVSTLFFVYSSYKAQQAYYAALSWAARNGQMEYFKTINDLSFSLLPIPETVVTILLGFGGWKFGQKFFEEKPQKEESDGK